MKRESTYKPVARSERLLVEEMDDETLVYDLGSHKAHCLNATSAHVWSLADGERTVTEIAEALPDLGLPADETLVWYALGELADHDLLAPAEVDGARPRITRRELVRALGLAAGASLLMPAVSSVTAPLAAQAASCLTNAQCRAEDPSGDCTGLPICNYRTWCCTKVQFRRRAFCLALPC